MIWKIEEGIIVGTENNKKVYPEAKHIFPYAFP